MKKLIFFFFVFILNQAFPQSISGFIKDKNTGESIAGVTILNSNTKKSTISNSYGYFSIQVDEYPVKLQFTSVSFKKKTLDISKEKNQNRIIYCVVEQDE